MRRKNEEAYGSERVIPSHGVMGHSVLCGLGWNQVGQSLQFVETFDHFPKMLAFIKG